MSKIKGAQILNCQPLYRLDRGKYFRRAVKFSERETARNQQTKIDNNKTTV